MANGFDPTLEDIGYDLNVEAEAANEADASEADLLSKKGLINKEPAWNTIDIINSLHPDFVANASPEELDYAISVVKGNVDYDITETLTPELGAMEMRIRQITAQNEALDQQIKEMEAWNKKAKKEIKSASVSPWMAEVRLGPPIGSGGNVGAYIEQQQMGMGPPLGGGIAPTLVEDESAWGAGSYLPTVNIEKEAPLGKIDVTGQRTRPLNTLEQWQDWVENPVNTGMQGLSGSYNIGTQAPWVESTTTADTKKTDYGDWKGKLNKETKEKNLKDFNIFQKAWMEDFKKDKEFVEHFKMVEKLGGHIKAAFTPSYMKEYQRIQGKYNKLRGDDAYLTAYGETVGINPVFKGISNLASKGVGMFGKWGTNMARSRGLGSAETYAESKARIETQEYEGQADVPQKHPSEDVTGGFWGLMAFAKKNPKIFGSLSGDELWSLISDPDGFWEFYEAALAGD